MPNAIKYNANAADFIKAIVPPTNERFVVIGCVGEFIADFTKIKTDEWRHQFGRLSLLVLIVALAFELTALVRTNILSGQEIAWLNRAASDAKLRAAKAEEHAKILDKQVAAAQDDTASLQKDAARLTKEAEGERLARVKVELELANIRRIFEVPDPNNCVDSSETLVTFSANVDGTTRDNRLAAV